MDDARPMEQNTNTISTGSANKKEIRTEEEEGERSRLRIRSVSFLSDMKVHEQQIQAKAYKHLLH